MMTDARRGRFDVVTTWACDRIARSARHFLDVLDELSRASRLGQRNSFSIREKEFRTILSLPRGEDHVCGRTI
jgi:cell division inhibitor SulA